MTARPRAHDDLRMSGEGTILIAVPPPVVYGAVSDLRRMGEWSPENRGGDWVGPVREPVVGAIFRGANAKPEGGWETLATVIVAEPPFWFAFRVATPGEAGTTWSYELRADAGGTVVTERFEWRWTPRPDEGFRARVGRLPLAQAVDAVAERERHLRAQIDATLPALRQVLETEARGT
jgi:hypothetical protein